MKNVFQSKTVWFNIVVTIVGIVTAFQSIPIFEAYSGWLVGILAVGNVILRVWFTTLPVSLDTSLMS